MSGYLRFIEQNETWRRAKAGRHIIDRFNENYDVIYDSDEYVPDPDAIREFACASDGRDYDLIYCDEDVISGHMRSKPYFKPGYSPENERSLKYISGMAAVRKGLDASDLGIFSRDKVCHIEKTLYHRINERKIPAIPQDEPFLDKLPGKISVILLSKDHPEMLKRCVSSVRSSLAGDDTEFILIDNGSEESNRRSYEEIAAEYDVKYFYRPSEFNYSELNNYGASKAQGDILIFMNDDIEVPYNEKGVIEKLAFRASRDDAGAVGIKLLYPEGDKIQHCGIALLHSGPSHMLQGYRDGDYYYGYSTHDINTIAVTGACLAVSHERFDKVGGFDESFRVAYNDVDLCVRLYESGQYNICMNSRHLIHYEGMTRSDDHRDRTAYERLKYERRLFDLRHKELKENGDPFMNTNLSPYRLDFDINLPYEWELSGYAKLREFNGRTGKKKRMHYSLDAFRHVLSDAYGNEDFYEALGWAFKEGRGRLKPCVLIEKDGKWYAAEASGGVYREDVGEAFPKIKGSADSGFIARIPAAELEKLGLSGKITAYPALMDRRRHIYTGDERCQIKTETD